MRDAVEKAAPGERQGAVADGPHDLARGVGPGEHARQVRRVGPAPGGAAVHDERIDGLDGDPVDRKVGHDPEAAARRVGAPAWQGEARLDPHVRACATTLKKR